VLRLVARVQPGGEQIKRLADAGGLVNAMLLGDREAQHIAMEALGQMVWESQRSCRPPDGEAYLENVRRAATK
jgi:hypothetical protein